MNKNISKETAIGILTEVVRHQALRDSIYGALHENTSDSNPVEFNHFGRALFNIDENFLDSKTEEKYLAAWQNVLFSTGDCFEQKAKMIYERLSLLSAEINKNGQESN